MAHADGKAQIQHADTGETYEIDGAYLVFKVVLKHKRIMGIEKTYSAELDHPQLGKLTWKVWEYPLGKIKKSDFDVNRHTLMKNINFTPDDGLAEDDEERQRKIDVMIEWFHATYEDPQNSLSYDKDDEYGYVWSRGGPCDASYELQENFPDEDYDIIEAAVEKIQDGGTVVWSPINDPEEHDDELLIDYNLKEIEEALNTLIDTAPKPKTAPAFALDDNNQLYITDPPDNQPVDSQDDLLNGLRTVVDDLLQSLRGANFHQDLIPIIERYKEALSGNKMSISQLYWCGIQLKERAWAIKHGIEAKEQPSLSLNTESNLNSVLELHGTYIMLNPEGQRLLEASAAYKQSTEQKETLKEASQNFANSITENHDLFGADVREHFHDFSNDIGKGQYPERSNQSAVNKTSNLVLGVLIGFGIDTIIAIIQNGIIAGMPGKMASTTVTNLSDKVWSFLTNIVPSLKVMANSFIVESSWLMDVVRFLERIIPMIPGF